MNRFPFRIYFLFLFLSIFSLTSCASKKSTPDPTTVGAAPTEEKGQNRDNPVRVYFATNREETMINNNPGEKFNYVIADTLTYGHCDVSIPPNHKKGEFNSPSMLRFWNRDDKSRYIVLTDTEVYTDFSQFAKELQSDSNKLFIFIHGFNVGFGDAARRTAQMARDWEFKGKAVFFSWPSRKKLLRYKTDSDTEIATRPMLEYFLDNMAERFPDKEFYIVAHSMGTSLFSETVINLMSKNSKFKDRVKGVVLAAPDINNDAFKSKIAPAFSTMNTPVTIYTSKNDLALLVSKWYWKGPRLGRNIFGDNYLEIVDASKVDTDLIGHSYYGGSTDVLYDIDEFITVPAKALKREWLVKTDTPDGPYWFLPPGSSPESFTETAPAQ